MRALSTPRGSRCASHGSPNNVTGGWPGLCFDWEPVREAGAKYIQELIKVVSPHKSLFGYDCWNEPHIEPAWARNIWAEPEELLFCYCERTIEAFRDWLQAEVRQLGRAERRLDAPLSQLGGRRPAALPGHLRRLG